MIQESEYEVKTAGLAKLKAIALHPGVDTPAPVASNVNDGILTLSIPLEAIAKPPFGSRGRSPSIGTLTELRHLEGERPREPVPAREVMQEPLLCAAARWSSCLNPNKLKQYEKVSPCKESVRFNVPPGEALADKPAADREYGRMHRKQRSRINEEHRKCY